MDSNLLNLLVEETPDAVIAISPADNVPHWNRAAETIFGYSREEALGHSLIELIVPQDRGDEQRRVREEAL